MSSSRKSKQAIDDEKIAKEMAKTPVMKMVAHTRRNVFQRNKQLPLTGVFYWVPIPEDDCIEWSFLEFYDQKVKSENASYEKAWPFVLLYLALKWNKSQELIQNQLKEQFQGLPRGRVYLIEADQYQISHGNDNPILGWKSTVLDRFVLRKKSLAKTITKFKLDPNSKMVEDKNGDIKKSLGMDGYFS